MPYCTAGKRTARGKQQQRYTHFYAPWSIETALSMSEVVALFEKHSTLTVAQIQLDVVITTKETSAQLVQFHVDSMDSDWSFTAGKHVPAERNQSGWHTLCGKVDRSLNVDVNNPSAIQWGLPGRLFSELPEFLAKTKPYDFDMMRRLASEILYSRASQAHI